jgi:hypothetical protein
VRIARAEGSNARAKVRRIPSGADQLDHLPAGIATEEAKETTRN